MTFEAPLKEELATVLISRKDLVPSHKADFIIKGTDIKIPFPDLKPKDKWCGGVQAYFVGLDKDWGKRWSMQEFQYDVFVLILLRTDLPEPYTKSYLRTGGFLLIG